MLPRPDFPKALAVPGEAVRILLLEDDPLSVEIVTTYLRRIAFAQCELHSTATLAEALALLSRAKVDLVISDLHLPDSAGAATVGALVRVAGCPVIAITSDLNPFLRDAVLACGAYDFLQKADLTEATLSRLVRLAAMQARTFHSLRESEARFRALTELSSDWYWEQDAQLRFIGTSGQSDGRAGITPQAHIGLCRWELPRTEIVGQTWDEHRRVLEARQPFHDLLLRRRAANGEVSYVSVDGRPIFDAGGAFTGYRGIAKEVTSRVAAEMALRESEARFRSLAGLSSDLYWEQDREFRFTAVSGIGPRIDSGRAQMLGKQRWERHYLNMTEAGWAAHRADLEARRPFRDLELGRINEEGAIHWVTVSGEPMYDEAGHFVGYRGVGKDITARKREEALLALEHAVTQRLASAQTAPQGIRELMQAVCETERWGCGRFFALDESAGLMRFQEAWGSPGGRYDAFVAGSRAQSYQRGTGLIGKVWEAGEPLWVKDAASDPQVAHAKLARDQGMHSALVFPATAGAHILGVVSISSDSIRQPDARLLSALRAIGSQLGHFLQRCQAEAAMRASESRLRAIVNNEPQCVKLLDADGRLIEMNPAGLRMLEADDIEPLRGQCVYDLVTPEHREAFRELTRRVAAGERAGLEFEVIGLKGTRRWLETRAVPLRDDASGKQLVLSLTRDVTEARQSEAALRESEERFRLTFELAGSGIAHVAPDGTFLRVNRKLCEILGYSEDELVGRSVKDISHADDRDVADAERARLRADDTGSIRLQKRYLHRSGRVVWVDLTVALARDGANAPLYEISIVEDISQRKAAEAALRESEARFRSLTELSADFYWETDARHRVLRTTHGVNHVPIDATDRQLGKARWEIPSTHPDANGWAAHRASLDAHLPFRDFELGRIDAEGKERHLSISGEPVFDSTGAFSGYRGIGREITARRHEEAILALEHAVTLCLAEAETAAGGLQAVLRSVCESRGWPAGRYYAVDEEAGLLRFSEAWGKPLPGVEEYLARSRRLTYSRGQGLSGQVWESGEPLWVKDVSKDPRASGSSRGALHGGAFLFPIVSDDRTIGVMSFSSADVRDPDTRLLKAVDVIGSQVGQFLMRKTAERQEQRRAEDLQRFRAAMDMAHDAIYLTDRASMRFLDANRVGCRALGYTREQLLSMGPHDVLAKSREELEREYDEVIACGADGIRTEATYARKDGHTGWTELFRRALRSGESWIIVTISRDITERKTEDGRLRRFRAALDAAAEPVLLVDARTGAYIDFNEAACRTFGYSREELLKLTVGEIRIDRTRERILQDYKRLAGDVDGDDMEITACRRKDGSVFPVEFTRRLVQTSDGPIVVASARDLTERLKADHRQAAVLKYQERVARFGQVALAQRQPAELIERAVQAVLEALGAEAVAYVEPEPGEAAFVARALVGVADAGAQPTMVPSAPGSPMADAMRSGARTLVDGARLPFPWAGVLRSTALLPVRGESGVRGLLCAGFKTTNAFAAEELNFAEAVASVLSTALQRIDSENRLAYLAQFDPLTGLANRTLLADRFSQMIVQAKRRDVPVAVLFIDLDGFKTVNDTLGHAGGDELLKEVGRRLQATVRDGDTVARISGDEFAIVLADMAQLEDAALVAQKVIDRLAATVDIAGKEVFVTASVGIAIYPGDGADADTLIGAADAAMYRAKQSGRNTFQFFTAEINQRSRARAQMGAELRRALEREEFALVYQPKIDLTNRAVIGAEALLRWKHPTRGLVSPAQFIPVLEETGLIVAVGDWVLRRACEDLKAWQGAGLAVGPVAVNLSARQFRRGDLDSHIKALVRGVGIEASLVELEITESQLMQDPAHAIRVMRALRDAGMRIAIDDFGTGYSSLAYLNRFPVSALKIDRSFVKDMAKGKDDATIVRTIIEMAHSLGFTVVAEGVETEEQATFLRLLRCEQAQGYLFAKPMAAEDYVKRLAKR